MHARELIELAALTAIRGPRWICDPRPVSERSIQRYWVASKCRLDRWGRALKEFSDSARTQPPPGLLAAEPARAVFEEILTGEFLARVWAAVTYAHDRTRGTQQIEPLTHSVLLGQLEARHRVLTLLVRGPAIGAEEAVRLDHLRRRVERWSDMLIGFLIGVHDVSHFAADPQRALEFADDLSYHSLASGGRHAWPLLQTSLRAAFGRGLSPLSPNADLNAQIATSVLSCFHFELPDASDPLTPDWLARMTNAAADAAGMVEQLLQLDSDPTKRSCGAL